MMKSIHSASFSSKLRFCSKNLSTSTAIVGNSNEGKEYVENKTTNSIIPEKFFNSKQILSNIRSRIPDEFLVRKSALDSLYLINPLVARKIGATILPYLEKNTNRIIAECNPGLGLLTRQLLKNEIGFIKLFEPSLSFREQLKKLVAKNSNRLHLYSKNLLNISSFNYSDRMDCGGRVEKLLKNVPKKGWMDDPCISIIAPMLNNEFLRHIIANIPTQTSLAAYGRVEMFFIMKPSQYLVLSTETDLYLSRYNYMTVLFNLLFEYKLLQKVPREVFLPWERSSRTHLPKLYTTDNNMLYLVHIVVKKDLPLPLDELVSFYIFTKKFFKRKARIIPMLEFCVPNSGVHIMLPQLQHEGYFKHMDIFTEFRELTPHQVLCVFRELYNHPNYKGSPLFEMVEAEMMKTESIESSYTSGPENHFIEDMEEELDFDDNFTEEDSNYSSSN